MVWDILDLWSNKWIPRREEVKAKRINEIHAEAEQKLGLHPGMVQMRNGQAANAPGHANMPGGYMPGAGGMPGAPLIRGYMVGLEADGWETVGVGRKTKWETMGVRANDNARDGDCCSYQQVWSACSARKWCWSQGTCSR